MIQDQLQCQGLYNVSTAYQDKSTTAICTLTFCLAPHSDLVLFTGTCQGTIVTPMEGDVALVGIPFLLPQPKQEK